MQAFPVYKDDLAIDYEHESGQEFFRGKFSGKLTFVGDDYIRIVSASFDAEFGLQILISYDAGQTWESYWTGHFWKTDCDFNGDDETVIVTPTLKDRYNDVLAGMDKEYDLIKLKPEIAQIKYDKRPMLQVYLAGQSVIGCFLSGMWWEKDCESVSDETALHDTYHFTLNKRVLEINIEQTGTPQLQDVYFGDYDNEQQKTFYGENGYDLQLTRSSTALFVYIVRRSDNTVMWSSVVTFSFPFTTTLDPVPETGASGNVTVYAHLHSMFARIITDVEENTYPLPQEDIVENNLNYTRVIGLNSSTLFQASDELVLTPTEYGIYEPGKYYAKPVLGRFWPISRKAWGRLSFWISPTLTMIGFEEEYRKTAILKDAFPLSSVISVLLNQIAPGITHAGQVEYSEFLYASTNPLIANLTQTLFITPKSNIISSGYDQPAQKAPITLKTVLDMLKNCFRCYWFIDEQNRFRIEHIAWFMRGGTYASQEPQIGINLTEEIVTRNGKPWSYARNQYKFDKPEMAARYQFKWMDDVTDLFDGEPIDIISKYVNPDNIEEISVQQFTSDIDYILLNPSEISKDGFVLLAPVRDVILNSQFTINILGVAVISSDITDEWKNGYIRFEYSFSEGTGTLFAIGSSETSRAWTLGNSGAIEIFLPEDITTLRVLYGRRGATLNVKIFGTFKLPYVSISDLGADYSLQNGRVAFVSLQEFYKYDMPARRYKIDGSLYNAVGVKKLKTQEINFPVLREPDLFNLIKTELGDGAIQKMSVNLSSRNAKTTLKYDTE